jgi:Putative metallopeptidase
MLRPFARFALAGLCVLAALTGALGAEHLTKKQQAYVKMFAGDNALFVLYHESAHLLVDQLQLPVLGKEEDAADNMASWVLLNKHTEDADRAIADAARGWQLSGVAYGTQFEAADFYDQHSLNQQRAYAIVCLMVGSDDKQFAPVAKQYDIPNDRQDSCYFDYKTLDRSMSAVLQPYMRKNGKGQKIEITYNAAAGRLKPAADAFKGSGVFEDIAKELSETYVLPRKIRFLAKRCGETNAFYDPKTISITFCYELMDDFMGMIAKDLPEETEDTPVTPEVVVKSPGGLGKSDGKTR